MEEVVGGDVLEIETNQITSAKISDIAAYLVQLSMGVEAQTTKAHSERSPRHRMLADVVPRLADRLNERQDVDGRQP